MPLGYLAAGTDPVGLSFLGPANTEQALLAYAYAFEQDARVRVPPTDANPALQAGQCSVAVVGVLDERPRTAGRRPPDAEAGPAGTGISPPRAGLSSSASGESNSSSVASPHASWNVSPAASWSAAEIPHGPSNVLDR